MSDKARYRNRVKVSERHGAGEWMIERVTLLLLLPLGLWIAFSAFTLAGVPHDAVMDWFARPLNAALAGAALLIFCLYASLAWKIIIEDYIHRPGNKALLLAASNLVFLALAAAGVFLIVRLALGSAPLPAGLGV